MERLDIQNVLQQMRSLQSGAEASNLKAAPDNSFANQFANLKEQIQRSQGNADASASVASEIERMAAQPVGDVPSFGEMFKSAIDTVNENQAVASDLATRYEQGDAKVDLPEVMIALQKSSVSFQAMTQVRNKMIEAYKEIINMPL